MYPWRLRPDPYATLVSEVMLQQTQAARVAAAFERFVARYPDVATLAAASRADVLRAWDGLGYNRRAVALSRAARAIRDDHGGVVPEEPAELRRLPGVGPYTASAIAAIAYGHRVAAVDVNVRRVVGRAEQGLMRVTPARTDGAEPAALELMGRADPSAWNQALMDLGREVCRLVPRCGACPIRTWCRWRLAGGPNEPVNGSRRRRDSGARPDRFEGSFRQVRGSVIRVLRTQVCAPEDLPRRTGHGRADLERAVAVLVAEGAVERTHDGRFALAEGGDHLGPPESSAPGGRMAKAPGSADGARRHGHERGSSRASRRGPSTSHDTPDGFDRSKSRT
jgi:A/G-specific adenine glycosylase